MRPRAVVAVVLVLTLALGGLALSLAASADAQPAPARQAHRQAHLLAHLQLQRGTGSTCPGTWELTKKTGIKTRSGDRWGTSMVKMRHGGEQQGFCGRVTVAKRFRNTHTVVSLMFRSYANDGSSLGFAGGKFFGNDLHVATFIGDGIQPGEFAKLFVHVTSNGKKATARTLRVTMP